MIYKALQKTKMTQELKITIEKLTTRNYLFSCPETGDKEVSIISVRLMTFIEENMKMLRKKTIK